MNKIRFTFFFVILLLLLSALTGCSGGNERVDRASLEKQMNEYIAASLADGSIDELKDIWRSPEAKTRTLFYEELPAKNGRITMGTAIYPPFSVYENGHYGGVTLELVYRFCEVHGYGMEVIGYNDINAMVMAVAAEKCDIGGTTTTITEERKKAVDFSDAYANVPFVVWVRAEDAADCSTLEDISGRSLSVLAGSVIPDIAAEYLPDCPQFEYYSVTDSLYALSEGKVDASVTISVLPADIVSAFPDVVTAAELPYENIYGLIYPKQGERNSLESILKRTFVENDRWSLFLGGILITVEISALSILFGSVLGFAIYYFILRRPKKAAKAVLDIVLWIIRCTPAVLFLLIFYYIIFGSSGLGGTSVCVVAFTAIFAATFLGCFTSAMNTVDPGQDEASLALGYTPRQSFFRILFPQALDNLWPNFQNAVINHIKATSIVGYVAVVDVTKAGDMIRSSTYDALVPLISAAIFYFAVIWLITFLIRLIRVRTEPSERSRKRRLKGVREHD